MKRKTPVFRPAGTVFTDEARAILRSMSHHERRAILAQYALDAERQRAGERRRARADGATKSQGKKDAHHAAVDAGIALALKRFRRSTPSKIAAALTEEHREQCLCGHEDCERPRDRAIGARRVARIVAALALKPR